MLNPGALVANALKIEQFHGFDVDKWSDWFRLYVTYAKAMGGSNQDREWVLLAIQGATIQDSAIRADATAWVAAQDAAGIPVSLEDFLQHMRLQYASGNKKVTSSDVLSTIKNYGVFPPESPHWGNVVAAGIAKRSKMSNPGQFPDNELVKAVLGEMRFDMNQAVLATMDAQRNQVDLARASQGEQPLDPDREYTLDELQSALVRFVNRAANLPFRQGAAETPVTPPVPVPPVATGSAPPVFPSSNLRVPSSQSRAATPASTIQPNINELSDLMSKLSILLQMPTSEVINGLANVGILEADVDVDAFDLKNIICWYCHEPNHRPGTCPHLDSDIRGGAPVAIDATKKLRWKIMSLSGTGAFEWDPDWFSKARAKALASNTVGVSYGNVEVSMLSSVFDEKFHSPPTEESTSKFHSPVPLAPLVAAKSSVNFAPVIRSTVASGSTKSAVLRPKLEISRVTPKQVDCALVAMGVTQAGEMVRVSDVLDTVIDLFYTGEAQVAPAIRTRGNVTIPWPPAPGQETLPVRESPRDKAAPYAVPFREGPRRSTELSDSDEEMDNAQPTNAAPTPKVVPPTTAVLPATAPSASTKKPKKERKKATAAPAPTSTKEEPEPVALSQEQLNALVTELLEAQWGLGISLRSLLGSSAELRKAFVERLRSRRTSPAANADIIKGLSLTLDSWGFEVADAELGTIESCVLEEFGPFCEDGTPDERPGETTADYLERFKRYYEVLEAAKKSCGSGSGLNSEPEAMKDDLPDSAKDIMADFSDSLSAVLDAMNHYYDVGDLSASEFSRNLLRKFQSASSKVMDKFAPHTSRYATVPSETPHLMPDLNNAYIGLRDSRHPAPRAGKVIGPSVVIQGGMLSADDVKEVIEALHSESRHWDANSIPSCLKLPGAARLSKDLHSAVSLSSSSTRTLPIETPASASSSGPSTGPFPQSTNAKGKQRAVPLDEPIRVPGSKGSPGFVAPRKVDDCGNGYYDLTDVLMEDPTPETDSDVEIIAEPPTYVETIRSTANPTGYGTGLSTKPCFYCKKGHPLSSCFLLAKHKSMGLAVGIDDKGKLRWQLTKVDGGWDFGPLVEGHSNGAVEVTFSGSRNAAPRSSEAATSSGSSGSPVTSRGIASRLGNGPVSNAPTRPSISSRLGARVRRGTSSYFVEIEVLANELDEGDTDDEDGVSKDNRVRCLVIATSPRCIVLLGGRILVSAVLDTGSQICTIARSILDKIADLCGVHDASTVNMRSAHGDVRQLAGLAVIPVHLHGFVYHVQCWIVDDTAKGVKCPYQMLLGQPFIQLARMHMWCEESGDMWAKVFCPTTDAVLRFKIADRLHPDNQYSLQGFRLSRG
ncbi:hypothetical protein BCR33DRAFT_743660 [Rhizoclosmatium globosum]|uniref:Uncharacterized protein n=1 Tax=Rhizoclosmatium globosum TaxID=329046 RepID=A0A1Y2BH60_9FUNG|nr:hypothetical protein BCR33DRAFT_743660 [Rhizoclosmatium globosum]|eukprot:ORY34134.1 hypothetical protein BCR33DRAFT_743660 [Rhizoclosmatium globosum]